MNERIMATEPDSPFMRQIFWGLDGCEALDIITFIAVGDLLVLPEICEGF